MSKSRQHWQEDSSDYTFNQYTFYLIILGLVIAGLIVWYVRRIGPPEIANTHFVSIVSRSGGELPVIPFQDEDFAALNKILPDATQYEFDDIASFDEEVSKLKQECETNQDIDTVIIWLSAVGSVLEGKPVVLGSDPGKTIPFESLIENFSQLKSEHVILLLDCNHAVVDPAAYLNGSNDSDFNQFPNLVGKALENQTGKVKVVLYGVAGEKPLYSTTRRRSLLASALEQTLIEHEALSWDAESLTKKLDQSCLSLGGTSTPQLKWHGDPGNSTTFNLPRIVRPEVDPDAEPTDPSLVEPHPNTVRIDKETNKTWLAYQKIEQRLPMPPIVFARDQWLPLNQRMIEFSAEALQSSVSIDDYTSGCRNAVRELQDFFDRWDNSASQLSKGLNLMPPSPDSGIEESSSVIDKRAVTRKFIDIHDLYFRAQHYAAVADSLSWIMPDDDWIKRYNNDTVELVDLLEKTRNESAVASVFQKLKPSLDQFEDIDNAHDQLIRQEKRLIADLNFICRDVLRGVNGFQKEMAVEAILRLPFLAIEKPDKDDEDQLYSRERLQELLLSNAPNPNSRVPRSDRESASLKRIKLYRTLQSAIGNAETQTNLSRRLQVFAYRIPTSRFDFAAFEVKNKTLTPVVTVTRRNELVNGDNYIETTATPIELGLLVENTQVSLMCEIIQDEKYFGFPDTDKETLVLDGTQTPLLVALQTADGTDPSCILNISIVDKNDPLRVFEEFDVPIRLPSKNLIELIVDFGGDTNNVFRQGSLGEPIRPFANRKDLPCNFSLRNVWHKERTGTISLYACAGPSTPTIVGKINEEVKSNTVLALDTGNLKMIASAKLSLPGSTEQATPVVPLKWDKPPGDEEEVPVRADYGFLCVIDTDSSTEDWQYWIPIFPIEAPVVGITPIVDANNLMFEVRRPSFFPSNLPVELRWYFSDERLGRGQAPLAGGKERDEFAVVKNVAEQIQDDERPFLYVDLDGWPRKYVFKYDGTRFAEAQSTNDAAVEVALGQPGDEPPEKNPLVKLKNDADFDRVYGTSSPLNSVTVKFSPNVPSMNAFSFATAEDQIRLIETGDEGVLHYPRQISHSVQRAEKSGTLYIESKVTDHVLTFDNVGSTFKLNPKMKIGSDRAKPLTGPNRIQIQFDRRPPKINAYRVSNNSSIEPGDQVFLKVDADDGDGVGIEWSLGVEIFLSDKNGNLRNLTGKPLAARYKNETFEFDAPQEPGKYTVGIRVSDRVGKAEEDLGSNRVAFTVMEKTVVPAPNTVKPIPKVYTHNWSVVVAPKNTDLANVTDPEVEIKPEGPTAKISGNTYTFSDLKEDVTYTITAKCKLKSGIAKGRELSGRVSQTFPKGAKASLTVTGDLPMK